ncbi:hypothetical protein G6011_02392 [Alternaria panax]|uniref:CFEM domain-containing protein n=1 Tax=Alternaria panax TaxID=48097 RepID=A0AAD4FDG8_9PLEO|nr:hypothetical protein G6011_02392 [Alternaria panax]
MLAVAKQLPSCAQVCLATAVAQSPVQHTDLASICTDAKLQGEVEACVMQSCTLRQSLTTKNVTSTSCHAPIRYSGESIRISNLIFSIVTAVCALSRVIYKAVFSIGELGYDDYSVLATLIAGVPSVVIIDRAIVSNGLGKDVWTVSFEQITNFGRYLYALEILYFIQIALLKLTLLFFFLRIFPKPVIRRLLWATIAFNCLNGVAFTFAAIFQCRPISFYWTNWDKEGSGQCIDINGLAWTNAIISIILDIWMLALPLYEVFYLQLSWRKKLSVAVMFCVGTFVTVISILRLRSLVSFAASANPTWDQTDVINWSNIEINIGVICACLPALRVILVHLFPKILGTTKSTERPYYAYGSQSHGMNRGGSALASGLGRSAVPNGGRDANAITYTKTFEIRHTDNDEQSLVQLEMDQFGLKKQKNPSSSTSISSL